MSRFASPRAPRRAAAALAAAALAVVPALGLADPAAAAPGQDDPWYYLPSDASLTDVPTYETDRARANEWVTNGQDFDHYCVADQQAISIVTTTNGVNSWAVPMQVSSASAADSMKGSNGLLYMNQWGGAARPFYRVVWATDFPTTNSVLTLTLSDQLTPDPVTEIIPGGSRFRTYDWSTYTLGLQNGEPQATTPTYIPGPYTGVNPDIFTVNPAPNPAPRPWTVSDGSAGRVPFTDPYWPNANEYVVDPVWRAENISISGNAITIDLGDQPANSMIVFTVSATSSDATIPAQLTANFTADYVSTDPANTVCYPVSVSWEKQDAETQALLTGAEFSLAATGGTLAVGPATSISSTSADGTHTLGTADGLRPGNWELTEATAPAGYAPAGTTIPVTLDFENPSLVLDPIPNSNEAPTITGDDLTVTEGDAADLLDGIGAEDREDGDITGSVVVVDDGGFDAGTPGVYTVEYSVTDAGGKTVTYTRTITVLATPTPEPTTQAPTQGPTQAPTTPTAPAPSPTAATPMPSTGTDAGPALGAAALLTGIGLVALVARRRMA